MNLVFLGPPGAGKGTQAAMVCKKYDIPHISTGNILRAAIAEGTKMGIEAKKHIDAGNLVPDEVVIGIVEDRLSQDDCKKGYLLDGFPRTIAQAKKLDEFASLDIAVLVDVDDEALVERLSSRRTCEDCSATYDVRAITSETCEACSGKLVQRSDDSEETVKNRLKVYHEKTSPLVEYYEGNGILCKVDGRADIDIVFNAICEVLDGV
jgi:adenylate kinase